MQTLILFSVISSATVLAAKTTKPDAALPASKAAVRAEIVHLWPTKTITYELDLRMPEVYRTIMRIAFEEVENKTCLRFTEREPVEDDEEAAAEKGVLMVRFSRDRRCASSLGYKSLPYQFISLHPVCFASLGSILRQIMLTLGIDNEHNRPDRDQYITINVKNIEPKSLKHFRKFTSNPAYDLHLPYDYSSLMHFDDNAFAINKTIPTLIPKKALPNKVVMGQRTNFSPLDVKKINMLYCKKDDGITE